MDKYLSWLIGELASRGVRFEHDKIIDLADVQSGSVINCTGLGARELINDFDFVPYKGQYYVVQASSGAPTEYVGDDDFPTGMAYVIPRGGEVLVGGTAEKGGDDLIPTTNWKAVVLGLASTSRGYVHWRKLNHLVGVRPARPSGVRLERQVLNNGNTVIHNYGHGGSGFSLSWGCALEVLNLLSQ